MTAILQKPKTQRLPLTRNLAAVNRVGKVPPEADVVVVVEVAQEVALHPLDGAVVEGIHHKPGL